MLNFSCFALRIILLHYLTVVECFLTTRKNVDQRKEKRRLEKNFNPVSVQPAQLAFGKHTTNALQAVSALIKSCQVDHAEVN